MGSRKLVIVLCSLALVLGLTAAGCGSDESSSSAASGDSDISRAEGAVVTTEQGENEVSEVKAAATRPKPDVEVSSDPPPEDLVVEDLEEGTGVAAKEGDVVEINYVGVLYKDGKEFENTYDTKDPLFWRIGAHEVIRGWEQGMKGMKVGGRRELTVPPSLGFKPGQQDKVPQGETIVYVIDLIKAETAPNAPQSRFEGKTRGEQVQDGKNG